MNILLLTDHSLTWDEAPPSRLLHLAREIAAGGHAVRVVGARGSATPRVPGVTVLPLAHRTEGGWMRTLFPLRAAVREQVRWSDALIVRGYWIGFWALLQARLRGRKWRIYDFHGMNAIEQWVDGRRLRSVSTWLVEQAALSLATDVLAASGAFRGQLSARRLRKCLLLENGVDPGAFPAQAEGGGDDEPRQEWGLRAGAPLFLMVAHFGSWLEPEVAVRAAASLREEIDLLVVGDGKGLEAARAEQRRLGAGNVHFTGVLPHGRVCRLLAMAHACVCPYKASWPLSNQPDFFVSRKVKEYMAAGKPVVCPDIPGRGPLLREGETSVLYRAGDSGDLARRMGELVRDPLLARRLGERGRELAQGFSWGRLYLSSGLGELWKREAS